MHDQMLQILTHMANGIGMSLSPTCDSLSVMVLCGL
jgi:hypothetical protein